MPESPRLPWELLDAFIDELGITISDPSSRDALRSCALTCHRFHFLASGYLFSEIVVKSSSKATQLKQPDKFIGVDERLQTLLTVLTTNDTLAPRVRSFTIDSSIDTLHQSLYNNVHLLKILPKLSSLRHFGWVNIGVPFQWKALNKDILAALERLVSSPFINSLTFEGVTGLPRSFVVQCKQLEHLRLVTVSSPVSRQPPPPPHPNIQLKSITNFNSLDMLYAIIPDDTVATSCFSNLRDLHVWMNNDRQVDFAWFVMKTASKTLELLDVPELSHFRYPSLIPGPIDIGVLRNLQTIKLGCRLTSLDGVVFPMGICGLLDTPKEPMMVENIHIKLDWIDCHVGSEEARFISEPGWLTLDKILSDGFKYPALKNVKMELKLGYGWTQTPDKQPPSGVVRIKDKVQELAAGLLPDTSRSGAVKVKVQILVYKSIYAIEETFP